MLLKISPVVLGMALRSHSLSFFIAASMKLAVARFFAAAFVFGLLRGRVRLRALGRSLLSLLAAFHAVRVSCGHERGRLFVRRPANPDIAVGAKARDAHEGPREPDDERDLLDCQVLDLRELVERALSVHCHVGHVEQVEADVVGGQRRLNLGVI